uniref:Myelin-oligodendrocyte glycoprotein n=1 Tax=Dicentrarchus labrax TaxID=13489 RepID=A0A8P4K8I2_DICLA
MQHLHTSCTNKVTDSQLRGVMHPSLSLSVSVSVDQRPGMELMTLCTIVGQSQVVGSPQPIIAAPGDDVILPCHVVPQVNVAGLTVEWSRPDIQPDPKDRLSRVEYVHLYRDTREDTDMKLSTYVRRTELFTDGLRQYIGYRF